MGYLDNATGALSGMLPAPHEKVRIAVGPHGEDRLYIAYTGEVAQLLAAGAIDAGMLEAVALGDASRDVRGRPCRLERLDARMICATRYLSSIRAAVDLPGIGPGCALHVEVLRPRSRDWRLWTHEP